MVTFNAVSDEQLSALLLAGKVGVLPTDTIYGLVAAAGNEQAVSRLYALKRRERKPGTIIAASHQQLVALGLDKEVVDKVAHLWPNPISIIIPCSPELAYLDQGLGDVAARVPADEALRTLLEQTGPLVTSSANQPGEEPAPDIAQAQVYFGDTVDFYVDGGRRQAAASTILRYRGGRFETLRQGTIVVDENGRII